MRKTLWVFRSTRADLFWAAAVRQTMSMHTTHPWVNLSRATNSAIILIPSRYDSHFISLLLSLITLFERCRDKRSRRMIQVSLCPLWVGWDADQMCWSLQTHQAELKSCKWLAEIPATSSFFTKALHLHMIQPWDLIHLSFAESWPTHPSHLKGLLLQGYSNR